MPLCCGRLKFCYAHFVGLYCCGEEVSPKETKVPLWPSWVWQSSEHTLSCGPGFFPGLGFRQPPPEAGSVCSVLRGQLWKMHDIPHLGRRMSSWTLGSEGTGENSCVWVIDGRQSGKQDMVSLRRSSDSIFWFISGCIIKQSLNSDLYLMAL